jgi:hypothetical protein
VPCRDQLHVELLNDEIIVILPATTYGVVYYKPTYSPQLLVKDFLSKNDIGATITQAEFLARALQAANAKARELGWIVLEEKLAAGTQARSLSS